MAYSLATYPTLHAATDLAARSLHHPHTLIAFTAAVLCLGVATTPGLFTALSRQQERRLYWGGVSAAAVCAAVAVLPDWKLALGVAAFGMALMTASAYMTSPHIKIRGKIYAYHLSDTTPDPVAIPESHEVQTRASAHDAEKNSYGGITTVDKSWWNLVGVTVFLVVGMLVPHSDAWMRPAAISILLLLAIVFGYLDGNRGYAIARGQRLQFVLIAIMTLAIHTVAYLIAFDIGRRRPSRSPQR